MWTISCNYFLCRATTADLSPPYSSSGNSPQQQPLQQQSQSLQPLQFDNPWNNGHQSTSGGAGAGSRSSSSGRSSSIMGLSSDVPNGKKYSEKIMLT